MVQQKKRTLQVDAEMTIVLSAVAEHFSLSIAELRMNNRSRTIVLPRQISMYLAKQLTAASLREIGQAFAGKHETTVMHSIAKIHELRATDAGMNKAIETLLVKLNPLISRTTYQG
jgi:chromosomal replication initiator protein